MKTPALLLVLSLATGLDARNPGEQHDLAREQPELLRQLTRKLEQLGQSCQLSRDGADYRY